MILGMPQLQLRVKKRNSNADTMMREVGEQLNKNTKKDGIMEGL